MNDESESTKREERVGGASCQSDSTGKPKFVGPRRNDAILRSSLSHSFSPSYVHVRSIH